MLKPEKISIFSYLLKVLLLAFSGYVVIMTAFYSGKFTATVEYFHIEFQPDTVYMWRSIGIYLLAFLLFILVSFTVNDLARNIVLYALWACAIYLQAYVVLNLYLEPQIDLSHVYGQIMKCFENGSPVFDNKGYFGFYTNNIPVTILLYWLFRPFYLFYGEEFQYMVMGGIFNVLFLFIAYVCLYNVLLKETSRKTAFLVMVLVLTNPTFLAYAPYFYTDTLSLPFLCGGLLALVTALHKEGWKKQAPFYVLAAVLLAIGYEVRATTIFLVIAFFVYLLIRRQWKPMLTAVPCIAAGFLLTVLLFQPLIHHHVPYDTKESAVPVTHFLMMSSHDHGMYSPEDVAFTKGFHTYAERDEATKQVFLSNVRSRTLYENFLQVMDKESFVWSIGTHWYQQYTQDIDKASPLYEYYNEGEKAPTVIAFMQGYNAVLFLFIAAGILLSVLVKRKERPLVTLIEIYYFGAVLFYSFWEAHPRHSMSFLPLISVLAIPLFEVPESLTGNWKNRLDTR